MNPLFLNPWFLFACGAVVFVASGLGYLKGYTSQSDKVAGCEAKIGVIKGEQDALAEENGKLRLVSDRIIEDSRKQYAAAVAYWNSHPRIVRVLRTDVCPGQARPISIAGSQSDAPAGEPALSPEQHEAIAITVAECERVANDAVMDAAMVLHLQDFIKRQHEASK